MLKFGTRIWSFSRTRLFCTRTAWKSIERNDEASSIQRDVSTSQAEQNTLRYNIDF